MNKKLFPAKWVEFGNSAEAPIVRKEFEAENFNKAQIEICGLGNFYLYINGKKASDDLFVPAQSNYGSRDTSSFLYPINDTLTNRIYYLKYDITDLVHNGNNTVGIKLGNGWYNQQDKYVEGRMSFGDLKLIFRIKLYNDKNEECVIVSDKSLKWSNSYILKNNLYSGEKQDLTLFDNSWLFNGYDDSLWGNCTEIKAPDAILEEQTFPADKIIRITEPKLIFSDSNRKVYDMGENVTGWVKLKLTGKKGDVVKARYSEEINGTELVFESAGGEEFIQTDEYICNGEETTAHPLFVYHGFRYCEVTGKAEAVLCEVVHTPLEKTAHFECDNELLNWIFDTYVRTQLDNVHMSVPLDCPHRERLGYTGDGQITAASVMSVFNAKAFYKKWIKDILDCQDIYSGHIQHTAPFNGGGGGPGGWGCAVVIVPYMYYKYYGDKSVLEETYPAMEKWIGYMQSRSEDFLVTHEEKDGWCLGEWSTVGEVKIPPEYVNTCYLVNSLQKMKEICSLINTQFKFEDLMRGSINAIVKNYYDEKDCSFANALQAADAFALDIGLGNEKTAENLCEKYGNTDCITTGIFGTEILIRMLFEKGYADAALSYLTANGEYSFANMKRNGATTFWEWMNGEWSHNHPMFGGFIASLFQYLAGIKQSFTGEIEIAPCVQNTINSFCISRKTLRGVIKVDYCFDGNEKIFKVNVPKGVEIFRYNGKAYTLTEGENIFKI